MNVFRLKPRVPNMYLISMGCGQIESVAYNTSIDPVVKFVSILALLGTVALFYLARRQIDIVYGFGDNLLSMETY